MKPAVRKGWRFCLYLFAFAAIILLVVGA